MGSKIGKAKTKFKVSCHKEYIFGKFCESSKVEYMKNYTNLINLIMYEAESGNLGRVPYKKYQLLRKLYKQIRKNRKLYSEKQFIKAKSSFKLIVKTYNRRIGMAMFISG